jgi:hypothetical protein
MVSSRGEGSGKTVVDSVHGDISLTGREVRIIDTAAFQRLRNIKQLGMAQLVYPTATHTRFSHCVGAFGAMSRILEVVKRNGIKLGREEKENLRIAALVHDIGHYPYSHLLEGIDRVKLTEEEVEGGGIVKRPLDMSKAEYPSHEDVGRLIVTSHKELYEAIGSKQRAEAIADIFTRSKATDAQLSKLIHSSFDLDRCDYLLRDSYATGVPYGRIDVNYLLNNLRVSEDRVVGFVEKALAAVEHMLLARFFLYRTVYYHKTICGFEEACRHLLRRLKDREGKDSNIPVDGKAVKEIVASKQLHTFTDAFVDEIVQKAALDGDEVICGLARAIQSRRPPKLLKEVQVCEASEQQYHAGKAFMSNCRQKLEELSKEFSIPLGHFLLCERSVGVVSTPEGGRYDEMARMDREEIHQKAFEEEEKDIKIFMEGSAEPVSLVDVKHSLVAKYSGYRFQIFRLYVVYEKADAGKKIDKLQEKVKDWDKS